MKRQICIVFCLLVISLLTCNIYAASSSSLSVQMYNGNTAPLINKIFPRFKITNNGLEPVDLSDVKIRYYYTIDGERPQKFWCDWSTIGAQNVTGTFAKVEPATIGTDYYFEVGFTSNAGSIQPGQSIKVHNRIAKDDWSNYNQTDDYSFNPTAQTYQSTDKIKVIVNNQVNGGNVQGIAFKENGGIVASADVKLVFSATGQEYLTTTDSAGQFSFKDLPLVGNFVITINAPDGYQGSASSFINESAASEAVTVILTLPSAGVVEGNIILDGQVVPGAVVTLEFAETDYTATVVADANGNFSLTGLPTDGSFSLVAFDPTSGASASTISFLTSSINQQQLSLVLEAPQIVNATFSNGDFSNGTFEGWETSGDAKIVSSDGLFEQIYEQSSVDGLRKATDSGTTSDVSVFGNYINRRRRQRYRKSFSKL
jgi:hypothetical protein